MIAPLHRFGRWPKIILLGCALGLIFVMIDLTIFGHFERLAYSAPFKLSDEPVKQELTRVIGSQLAAFRNGDFNRAYGFADSSLRQEFTAPAFREMVRASYPAVATSTSATYGVVFDNGRIGIVMVCLISPAGRLVHYQYLLRREPVGWRISGVTRIRPQTTTA